MISYISIYISTFNMSHPGPKKCSQR